MAEAQRQLGAEAEAMLFRPHHFGYDDILRSHSAIARRMIALNRALRWADVVHLYFGSSLFTLNRLPDHATRTPLAWGRRALSRLMWMGDVPLLKRLGKIVAMTFLGDDVRQVDYTRASRLNSHLHGAHGDALAHLDRRKRKLAALAGTHADLIYATNPDLLEVLPTKARFLPYVASSTTAERDRRAPDHFTIAHAPSHSVVKGTQEVQVAMRRLADEGTPIVFDLIEGTSHVEALRRMSRADAFIDQLRVGWYGVAAIEALSRGCVTLGHLDVRDRERIPAEMDRTLPIRSVRSVEEITAAIGQLRSLSPEALEAESQAGIAWVERWHGASVVASSVLEDYQSIRRETT